MINEYSAKQFCCDDISLIEGYDLAIVDSTQTWHCHHRLGTYLDLSIDELKKQDLYYNRPSQELIFLKPAEHIRLHHCGKKLPPMSAKAKAKISAARKGKAPWNAGKHLSDEHRQKLAEVLKGENNPFYGKHHSKETLQKISDAQKGKKRAPMSSETKAKLSAAKKGRPKSEETKERMKLAWEKRSHIMSLAQRAKLSAALKNRVFSEETCQKMSEAKKLYWSRKRAQKLQEEQC